MDEIVGSDTRSFSEALFLRSRPRSRHARWQSLGDDSQLFVVNGSRLYRVGAEVIEQLDRAALSGDASVQDTLDGFGLLSPAEIDDTPLESPPIHALSLAVAQKCNLGCTYCYAGQGEFGGPSKRMTWEIAQRAVELRDNPAMSTITKLASSVTTFCISSSSRCYRCRSISIQLRTHPANYSCAADPRIRR
jgi:hypothetical protein